MALQGMPEECPWAEATHVVIVYATKRTKASAKYWYASEIEAWRAHEWLVARKFWDRVETRSLQPNRVIRESQCHGTSMR